MTESSPAADQQGQRHPLSFTQEWFLTLDQGDDGGTFGSRFMMVYAMRVSGPVDLAVLQGSLDDVVARHELLRTLVIRDADPPYQQVCPPCQVPLEVRDLPPVTGRSRDLVVQELILEGEAGSINATSTADDGAPSYWQHKLDGAREFTIPNDHGHPESYSRPYSQHIHIIEADVMA